MPLDSMEHSLPLEEEFIDHSGHSRRFRISIRKLAGEDFYLDAMDLSQAEGYRFEVYSAVYSVSGIGSALGKLRQKIRGGISTRYLHVDAEGKKHLTHNEMRGRISDDGILVDGAVLRFSDLERILTTYEGFEVSIRIDGSAE
jgi:hypothetical protein